MHVFLSPQLNDIYTHVTTTQPQYIAFPPSRKFPQTSLTSILSSYPETNTGFTLYLYSLALPVFKFPMNWIVSYTIPRGWPRSSSMFWDTFMLLCYAWAYQSSLFLLNCYWSSEYTRFYPLAWQWTFRSVPVFFLFKIWNILSHTGEQSSVLALMSATAQGQRFSLDKSFQAWWVLQKDRRQLSQQQTAGNPGIQEKLAKEAAEVRIRGTQEWTRWGLRQVLGHRKNSVDMNTNTLMTIHTVRSRLHQTFLKLSFHLLLRTTVRSILSFIW
jgi:hypothetical protein